MSGDPDVRSYHVCRLKMANECSERDPGTSFAVSRRLTRTRERPGASEGIGRGRGTH